MTVILYMYMIFISMLQDLKHVSIYIVFVDRPEPPGKPIIRNQVGTSVHLEWSPPPTPVSGGQIQGYTIELREREMTMWQAAIPYVPNTSQVIGDLVSGCVYQFRVSSNNSVGMSEPSFESDFVIIPQENGRINLINFVCVARILNGASKIFYEGEQRLLAIRFKEFLHENHPSI